MDNEEKIAGLENMSTILYRICRENEMSIREIECAFIDEKTKIKSCSVLRRSNEDLSEIISAVEDEISSLK